jgi:murein hydrolase activator
MRRLALVLAGAGLALAPAAKAAPAEDVAAAAARVSEAGAAVTAARGSGDRVTALAEAVAGYEAAVQALGSAVAEAAADAQARELALEVERAETSRLLAALEAVSRTPPPVPALHPQGPIGAARAEAMMMRLAPALRSGADRLQQQLADLAAAHELQAQARDELAGALATLGGARSELGTALTAMPAAEDPGPALTMMARDSETLTALADALAKAPDAPKAPSGTTVAMRWPVAGSVQRRFHEPDGAGVRRPGIVMAAPAQALVTAPADAIVRYAGPFLEYGYVVVLQPGAHTMVVLAGLAQLRVRTGATVHAGELLGMLGGRTPDVDEYVMLANQDTGAGGNETLYIEVRDGKGPVDPEPLFAGGNG